MLMDIFVFFLSLAFGLMLLSFFSKKNLIIPWMSTVLFFLLGILSFNVEYVFCSNNGTWDCHNYSYTDTGLGYLTMGMGLIMLIYSIYESVRAAGKGAVEGIKDE